MDDPDIYYHCRCCGMSYLPEDSDATLWEHYCSRDCELDDEDGYDYDEQDFRSADDDLFWEDDDEDPYWDEDDW